MRKILVAVLLVFSSEVNAGMIIDQSYFPTPTHGFNQVFNTSYSGNLPMGQEFTPTLNSLDFVDLYLNDAGSDIGPGAAFEVMIRQGSISGAILGTSNSVSVPDNFNQGVLLPQYSISHFTFATPVSLIPGGTYVIQIIQEAPITTGNFNFGAVGGPLDASTYAGGRAIVGGTPRTTYDFAFNEGRTVTPVPEPSSLALCGFAVISIAFKTRFRRRQQTT